MSCNFQYIFARGLSQEIRVNVVSCDMMCCSVLVLTNGLVFSVVPSGDSPSSEPSTVNPKASRNSNHDPIQVIPNT